MTQFLNLRTYVHEVVLQFSYHRVLVVLGTSRNITALVYYFQCWEVVRGGGKPRNPMVPCPYCVWWRWDGFQHDTVPRTVGYEAKNFRLDDMHVSYGSLRLNCELWNRGRGCPLEEGPEAGNVFFPFRHHPRIFVVFPWPGLLRCSIRRKGSPDSSREQSHRRGYSPISREPREKKESRLEVCKNNDNHLPGIHFDF